MPNNLMMTDRFVIGIESDGLIRTRDTIQHARPGFAVSRDLSIAPAEDFPKGLPFVELSITLLISRNRTVQIGRWLKMSGSRKTAGWRTDLKVSILGFGTSPLDGFLGALIRGGQNAQFILRLRGRIDFFDVSLLLRPHAR